MKFPLSWLKEYLDTTATVDEIAGTNQQDTLFFHNYINLLQESGDHISAVALAMPVARNS